MVATSPDDRMHSRLTGWPWNLVLAACAGATDLVASGVGMGLETTTGGTAPAIVVAAVVIGMACLLLLARRHPLLVLAGTVAISSGVALWIAGAQPVVCVLAALYLAARQAVSRPHAHAALGIALGYVVVLVGPVTAMLGGASLYLLLILGTFFTALILGVWALGRRDRASQSRAAALSHELTTSMGVATSAERRRISRELHDILAHSVSAMMMQAAGARAIAHSAAQDHQDDERLRQVVESLATIETSGSQSMRELHRLLGTLRETQQDSSSQDQLDHPGLADLAALVETARRSDLIVEVHLTGDPGELDPSVGAAAYRVAQESLTNAMRHAGPGALVELHEAWRGDMLRIQVRCRGAHEVTPPDAPSGGNGLAGLRERVELVGGSFEAGWVQGEFVTTAALPGRPAEHGDRDEAVEHAPSGPGR